MNISYTQKKSLILLKMTSKATEAGVNGVIMMITHQHTAGVALRTC